jgi:hypothetical protein
MFLGTLELPTCGKIGGHDCRQEWPGSWPADITPNANQPVGWNSSTRESADAPRAADKNLLKRCVSSEFFEFDRVMKVGSARTLHELGGG